MCNRWSFFVLRPLYGVLRSITLPPSFCPANLAWPLNLDQDLFTLSLARKVSHFFVCRTARNENESHGRGPPWPDEWNACESAVIVFGTGLNEWNDCMHIHILTAAVEIWINLLYYTNSLHKLSFDWMFLLEKLIVFATGRDFRVTGSVFMPSRQDFNNDARLFNMQVKTFGELLLQKGFRPYYHNGVTLTTAWSLRKMTATDFLNLLIVWIRRVSKVCNMSMYNI